MKETQGDSVEFIGIKGIQGVSKGLGGSQGDQPGTQESLMGDEGRDFRDMGGLMETQGD